jgi:hypothetical protein
MNVNVTPLDKKIRKDLMETFPEVDFDFNSYKYGISFKRPPEGVLPTEHSDLVNKIRFFVKDYDRGIFPTGQNAKQNLWYSLYRSSQQEGSQWQLESKKPKIGKVMQLGKNLYL